MFKSPLCCQAAAAETLGSILGSEDYLEKGMASQSSILTWKFPLRRKSCGQLRGLSAERSCLLEGLGRSWKVSVVHWLV